MNGSLIFPFPDVRLELVEILEPLKQRMVDRVQTAAEQELPVCDDCEYADCPHVRQSIAQLIELQARQLACTPEFIKDCLTIFVEQLFGELQSSGRAAVYAKIKKSKHFKSPVRAVEASDDQDVDEQEADDEPDESPEDVEEDVRELPGPRKFRKTSSVDYRETRNRLPDKTIKEIRQSEKTVERSIAARPVKSLTIGAQTFNIENRADEAVAPPPRGMFQEPLAPCRKRDLPMTDDGDDIETDSEAVTTLTSAAYHDMQLFRAAHLLRQMKADVPVLQLLLQERQTLEFPDLVVPDVHQATVQAARSRLTSGKLAEIFAETIIPLAGSIGDMHKIVKLYQWFSLIKKCYAYAGLVRLMIEGGNPQAKYNQIKLELGRSGVKGLPMYTTVEAYAQLGEFVLRYPRLVYQTRRVKIEDWRNFVLDRKKCYEGIRERSLSFFIDALLIADPALAAQWRQV